VGSDPNRGPSRQLPNFSDKWRSSRLLFSLE
jgi:hypothetical protein